MKNIDLSFIFLIIGAIVGAGFASGKEIVVFFSNAGYLSYVNIIIVSIFLYIVLKNLIILGQNTKTTNIKNINKIIFKKHHNFFSFFILSGLFIFVTAMVAGLNSIGALIFPNINFPVLTIISILFAIFIVNNGYSAIKKVNNILMPIVLIFLVVLSIIYIFNSQSLSSELNKNVINFDFFKYLSLGLCYISYNVVFASSLIVENSKKFFKKDTRLNCLIISCVLGFLLLVLNISLLKLPAQQYNSDLPMFYMAFNVNNFLGYLFGFVLWFSILTSLISSLYMLINAFKINKYLSSCIFLTLAFIFSCFGFTYIINIFYPLQGIIGLIYIVKIIQFNYSHKMKGINFIFINKKRI